MGTPSSHIIPSIASSPTSFFLIPRTPPIPNMPQTCLKRLQNGVYLEK